MADILQKFSQSGTGFKVRFIGLLFACLIHIVGFATEYWSSGEENYGGSGNMGLWRACGCVRIEDAETCICRYLPADKLPEGNIRDSNSRRAPLHTALVGGVSLLGFSVPESAPTYIYGSGGWTWLKAVRAMETLGLIFIVFAICGVVWILIRYQGNSIQMIPTVLIGGAGIQILIGVVVYGAKLHGIGGVSIHYSFVLCLLSGSICIILSLLMSYSYSTICRRSGDDTAITLTTTDAVISDLPATIERAGYDQPGNDPLRYEQPQIGRPRSQPREDTQGQRTQYPPGGFMAGLPSSGINSPPEYTPGYDYMRGQQIPVIANTQNVPGGDITTQPSHLTENLQRTPEKESRLEDRPQRMADTHSTVDTTGQFDGTADTHDC